jgi:hypothetical protein
MVAEGKLAWQLERQVIHLRLLVKRSSLEGYEAELVQALFFDGNATDNRSIREHYRQSGFDPTSLLRSNLQPRLDELTPRERRSDAALWTVFGALLLGSQLLLVPDIIREEQADWVTLVFCSALPIFLLSGFAASRFAKAITGHGRRALAIGLPLLALGGEVVWPAEASAPGTLGLALVWAAGLCMVVALARTRAGAGIAFQKRLVAARGYFALRARATGTAPRGRLDPLHHRARPGCRYGRLVPRARPVPQEFCDDARPFLVHDQRRELGLDRWWRPFRRRRGFRVMGRAWDTWSQRVRRGRLEFRIRK